VVYAEEAKQEEWACFITAHAYWFRLIRERMVLLLWDGVYGTSLLKVPPPLNILALVTKPHMSSGVEKLY
jgi:hypothetical protein